MREYSNDITLTKNIRGVYGLDTSIGCRSGLLSNPKGCYSECYAARYAKKYGYDFSKTKLRDFKSDKHLGSIKNKIKRIDSEFIRLGVSGDPSENWEHTFNIIKKISFDAQLRLFEEKKKRIVIITKHWNKLNEAQLNDLGKYNIYVNTSISAIDTKEYLNYRIEQYNRIKPYCKSILRIISFNFNLNNKKGKELNLIQNNLFKNENVLDTVFRVYKKNELVLNEIINIEEVKFLGKKCNISRNNKYTYFGKCSGCIQKCGINI